jgi:DNA-binding transcriptional LysR family regulator
MDIYGVDLALLRCFSVLMAERNVTKAAERLQLSQPAVSHALARLRRLFDDPLLLRGPGRMTPTSRALELDAPVARILAGVETLVARPPDFDPRHSRATFVLTATGYAEYLLAPTLLARLGREAPGVDIDIRTPNPELVPGWLERGEVDFRLGWIRDPAAGLRSKPLFQDKLVCLARRGHPVARPGMSVEQYLALPHVRSQLSVATTTGRVIDEAAGALGAKLRLMLLVQNYLTIPYVVAQSDVVATVPERLARGFIDQLPLQLIEPPLKLPTVKFALYWHERTHKDPRHRWFRQVVADIAKAI